MSMLKGIISTATTSDRVGDSLPSGKEEPNDGQSRSKDPSHENNSAFVTPSRQGLSGSRAQDSKKSDDTLDTNNTEIFSLARDDIATNRKHRASKECAFDKITKKVTSSKKESVVPMSADADGKKNHSMTTWPKLPMQPTWKSATKNSANAPTSLYLPEYDYITDYEPEDLEKPLSELLADETKAAVAGLAKRMAGGIAVASATQQTSKDGMKGNAEKEISAKEKEGS
jgi:hypothetical protein